MSWRVENTKVGQDLVWDGVETGIAPSPTKGTANIQNANIATSSGEAMASYTRSSQTPSAITNGTLTPNGATDFTGPANLSVGQWITVSASTVSSISTTTNPMTVSADYLVVGGGGAGGSVNGTEGAGGGGGGGRVLTGSGSFSVGSVAVTIGAGGVAVQQNTGGTGGSSIIAGVATAQGGAGGGKNAANGAAASGGGSGGGGGAQFLGAAGTGGAGATGGNNGGNANVSTRATGGGGGGAGAVGSNATSTNGGNGGNGTASSITGTSVTYGGGGGGGATSSANEGAGGTGGGGNGSNGTDATDGTANTGGGGGGQGNGGLFIAGDGGTGKVVISYVTGSCIAIGGTVSYTATNTVHTFNESGAFVVLFIPPTNRYYVSYKSGTTYRLSSKFDPTGANALTHGTTGSVTFSTVTVPSQAIAKSTETYTTSTGIEYRYYVFDSNSYLWLYDTRIYDLYGTQWMLPDPNNYSTFALTGLGVINGMAVLIGKAFMFAKPVCDLGRILALMDNVYMNEPFPTNSKFALVGNQGKLYYCDGNYIGEVFPSTSLITSIANIQSTCQYTASSTTGTVSSVVSGSLPYSPTGTRIPVVMYTDVYGALPTSCINGTVYYVEYDPTAQTFGVYDAITGGSAKDIATGASGNQFFTTFWPFGSDAGADGSHPTVQVSTQRLNLPAREVAQCMVEVGNVVLIGGITNIVYPWNQVDATPSDVIPLPESNVKTMINVNNIAYVFAGNKGNIYITNTSIASLALKVPDYCAGVPGTPLTYIEPYFTWGDAMFLRGRVYFSILDQTATKAGNCGGVWSFIPSQNIDPSQDVGLSLRLENQNSYGDYDGYATILIPNERQIAISPQYWAWWQDSYSTGTSSFGVDYTGTTPVTQYVIETDLLPTGTMLTQETYAQVEYKVSTPLLSGDSIQLYYRLNSTSAWATCGTVVEESSNRLSGYFKQTFQKTQWVQIRAVVTTGGTTASSFVRLKEIRLR